MVVSLKRLETSVDWLVAVTTKYVGLGVGLAVRVGAGVGSGVGLGVGDVHARSSLAVQLTGSDAAHEAGLVEPQQEKGA